MAAHRQYVPIRDTEAVFQVKDGTECRMPSPRPGPLRSQMELERSVNSWGNKEDSVPLIGERISYSCMAIGHNKYVDILEKSLR